MRVLVVAGPMQGHVNTLVPIALAAAGHDVAFATGPDPVDRVGGQGLASWQIETVGLEKPGQGTDVLAYFLAAT